jgi:hypothetical protein
LDSDQLNQLIEFMSIFPQAEPSEQNGTGIQAKFVPTAPSSVRYREDKNGVSTSFHFRIAIPHKFRYTD